MDNIAQLGIKVDSSSIKQATNELSKLSGQSGKTEQSTTNLTSVFSKVNIAIIATSASLSSLAKHGIEYSNTIEKLTNGLITLNVMTSKNIDSNGKALTLEEKYNLARIESLDIMTKLNAINIETPHTLEQTVQIYKSMYTTMRSANVSTEQMIDITKKLSIAAGSNGIEFQQLLAGIDGLATGTVEVSSELGRFLKSIGLTNESLKKSSNIYETINSKLKDVKGIESYDTAISNLTNSFDQLTGTLVQPFFEDIKSSINGLSKQFDTLTKSIKSITKDDVDEYTKLLHTIESLGIGIVSTYLAMGAYSKAVATAQTLNLAFAGSFNLVNARLAASIVLSRGLSLAMNSIPFVAVAGAVALFANYLLESSRNSKILNDVLEGGIDTLKGLTKNQLIYAESLLETELIQTRLNRANAVADAAKKGIFESKEDQLKDLAYRDEQIKKFDDQTKRLREIKTLRKEIEDNKNGTSKTPTTVPNGTIRNELEIIKLSGTELQKFNLTLDETAKKMKEAGATELEINKFRADSLKEFNEKQNKELEKGTKKLEETQKARAEIAQIGMSTYDKSISDITAKTIEWVKAGVSKNEVLSAEIKLRNELNSQTILENLQTELSYYEKKLQLQKDSLDKALELRGIQYSQSVLEIENSNKTIEQKQKLIALETELYDETIKRLKADNNTEFQDTLKSFQEDSLARQIELNNAIFDFGAGFKSSNSEIMEVSKALSNLNDSSLKTKKAELDLNTKYTKEFDKYAGDVEKTKELEQQYTKDTDLLNKQAINNQILGYANLSGAISGMFQQGSREAATFQAAQTVLALVEGTRAILTAGTGDPYTAIPRMAAMSIMVKSLLGNIGVSLGMSGSNTTSGDSFSMQKANTGTGSVLGDTSKASESITKSLSILEDYAKPEFRLSQQMSKSLESIDSKIGGVTSLLLQNSGTALGNNYTGGFDTGYKNNLKTANGAFVFNPINDLISKIPIVGQINGAIGSIINSAIGGIFGKTSVSQSLADSGITFADAYLKDAVNQLNGSVYQTISTTTTKKSWFSKSSSTSLSTYFTSLDSEINNQFSLVLRNLYDTVYQAGNALDIGSDSLNNSLNNFVVSIGKISLKDKTGTQIQELLTSIFGKIGDDLATSVVPVITQFQKVGEGTLTTLTRVASGMEQANYYIDRLGTTFQKVNFTSIINKQGDVGFEALYQSILRVEKGANFNNILSTLSGTAEELYSAYTSLDLIRDRLTFLGKGLDGLSISAISGAGGLEQLSDGISSFIENFYSSAEQQQLKVSELNQELSRTGITTIPTTIAGFKDLVNGIDTTTESGQKLYGSLISLSDSFYDVYGSVEESRISLISSLEDFVSSTKSTIQTDTTFKDFSSSFNNMIDAIRSGSEDLSDIGNATIDTAQSYLDTVSRTAKSSAEIEFANKIVANKFEGVINAKDITLGTINDTLKISFNEDSVIVKALNDVKNELVYLNQLNTRQTANSNKTLQLQRASIA